MILAYWYAETVNFGDLLTPYFIRNWTGQDPINLLHVHRGLNPAMHDFTKRATAISFAQRLRVTHKPEYVMVGSILGWKPWAEDVQVIWGAGFMSENVRLNRRPRELRAVRGERTLENLPVEWRKDVKALGDPGVLIGDMVETEPRVPGRIGFVPHYHHKNRALVQQAEVHPDIYLIDIQQGVESFIKQISTCEVVVASAMHAIISADGLGIPTRWIRIEDAELPAGGIFKFHDYFSIAGRPQNLPDPVATIDDVKHSAAKAIPRDVSKMKADLLGAAPFRERVR